MLRRAKKDDGSLTNTVGGAVLGGLLLGPFGAVFGASLGSRMGRQEEDDRAEVERMGLDNEMVSLAQSVAVELADAEDSLRRVAATKEDLACRTIQLEDEVQALGKKAMVALESGDEAMARQHLEGKIAAQARLDSGKEELSKAMQRCSVLEGSVSRLERRALDISSLLKRAQAATGSARTALTAEASRLSLSDPNDPFAAFDEKLGSK